jgi:hypothetical protein
MGREHKNIGSSFEDFLKEEGIFEEVEIAATKKAFDIQLEAEMKKLEKTTLIKTAPH